MPNTVFTFKIIGDPVPKQSARMSVGYNEKTNKHFPVVKQTKFIKARQEAYRWAIKMQLPKGFKPTINPIRIIEIVYQFAAGDKVQGIILPESPDIVYKPSVPDLPDNMNKLLCDAMSKIVYKDDKQIIETGKTSKIWGTEGMTLITLEVIEDFRSVYVNSKLQEV